MNLLSMSMLIISFIISIFMINYVDRKSKGEELYRDFKILFLAFCIHTFSMILQMLLKNTGIKQVYFEYFAYIGAMLYPIIFLNIASHFKGKKINWFKNIVIIVPIISLLVLWTNDLHRLFFKVYATSIEHVVYGEFFPIYSVATYALLIFAMAILIHSSIQKSGFFSKQTGLIIAGVLTPILVNVLGTFKIMSMSVYITPIMFTFTGICFALAIIKYKALNITPIAFRTVIDTMSDAFIVISDDGTIVDKNQTFEKEFGKLMSFEREDNLFKILEEDNLVDVNSLKGHIKESRKKGNIINEEYHIVYKKFDKYYSTDIHPIKASRGLEYVGTLILFKDITQHKRDIKIIEDKQEVIVKQGQLVSIGELAGGVAHDINTPISAIKTGIQLLTESTSERTDVEKELLFRMDNCADKIIKIVNSMRNQIRNLGSDQKIDFKISNVINDIRIITYNEIQKNKCELTIDIKDDVSVNGDPTKLGQVFTNLIVNAVQAYSQKGGKIEVSVSNAPNSKALIQVRDYAGGLPDRIKDSVFKEILTTKGSKGTGLGLYLAYSVIKGEFSGEISFESVTGQGTTFYIVLDRI